MPNNNKGVFNVYGDKGDVILSKINTAKTNTDKKVEYQKYFGFVPNLPGNAVDPDYTHTNFRDQVKIFLDGASYDFKYGYDRNNDRDRSFVSSSDIEIGEFYKTDNNQEDPIIFGYKLMIDMDSSPLFTAVEEFIERYNFLDEIRYIRPIYERFILKLRQFFSDTYNVDDTEVDKKRHYIRNISGLNNLSDSNTPSKYKSIVNYRNESLIITFTDDVKQSFNELAALYKILTWNKFSAKLIIPENLLRFNMKITVCDVRKFNRYYTTSLNEVNEPEVNTSRLVELLDNLNKIVYDVYECQFFFENFSHSDSIDLGAIKATDNASIIVSYKFSNVKFEKPSLLYPYSSFSIEEYGQQRSNRFNKLYNSSNSTIQYKPAWDIVTYKDVDVIGTPLEEAKKNQNNSYWRRLLENVKEAGDRAQTGLGQVLTREAQRQINKRLRLINDAINNAREALGLGQIGEPRNVYQGTSVFENELRNVGRRFFGDIARGALGGLNP